MYAGIKNRAVMFRGLYQVGLSFLLFLFVGLILGGGLPELGAGEGNGGEIDRYRDRDRKGILILYRDRALER